jgi:Ca-activated chloride channel family protein
MFGENTFKNPGLLYLLLALVPIILWYFFRHRKNTASIQVSGTAAFRNAPLTARHYLRHLPFILEMAAMSLFIIALARPQSSTSWENVTTEGIDIVVALDISTSMLAMDFNPNRLEAAKKVAMEFIFRP